ncbi:MAG: two-component regulator propeller domain-containing protein [Bryobacteraceae bacterium]|nr:two-component regulator propeller domain-containing protein [Bryobacteraceae bacterium]
MVRAPAVLLAACLGGFALNPSLDISQYDHRAFTIRDGFFSGNIYSIAQTADGYLWIGTEFGLVRFDGVRTVPWQPPPGQVLTNKNVHRLLAARDGTLWLGTLDGLFSWNGVTLTRHPETAGVVISLLEDRQGTVWAGGENAWRGWLCEIRAGKTVCHGQDGAFGTTVASLYQDNSGALWVGGHRGVWRWKPGPPRRYPTPPRQVSSLSAGPDGSVLISLNAAGLMQLAGDSLRPYPLRASPGSLPLPDDDVNANLLLRDREGALWIGTVDRGLKHLHHGRMDTFTKSDGLSGNVIFSLFEDREENVWVATSGGLDRFRRLPVSTLSDRQGLATSGALAVAAAPDGSVWISGTGGLTRWLNGQTTIFRREDGLPDNMVHSLFTDARNRIWASTPNGLAYFDNRAFRRASASTSPEIFCMSGDDAGHLWLSSALGLTHLREGRLVEHFPWPRLGRSQQAKAMVLEQGGLWLSFWKDGGLLYFKDGQVRASYGAPEGLGKGHVPALYKDAHGALWASTEEGGLSRLANGRIVTLTTRNGLPCNTIHWALEDDRRNFWLYSACGLIRVARSELDSWLADPSRILQTTLFDASDGVKLRSLAASGYGPTVAKATDGRIWFVSGEGVQVFDPRNSALNRHRPPVHIEQVVANGKVQWQNSPTGVPTELRLPPEIRNLQFDFTALSLVEPKKVHFKYRLEGQDPDWREVVNSRQAQYTNLRPGRYRFRVIASNNSGIWNETGASLPLVVPPAFYQTNLFLILCGIAFLMLLWAAHLIRLSRLRHEFSLRIQERVDERTRIARELHDTLLQSFHGLLLPLQASCNLLPDRPTDARRVLERAIDNAARAITEARDAVQGLRSTPSLCGDLIEAIQALGPELASYQPPGASLPAFSVHVEGSQMSLHPTQRDDIYRIVREALHNAYRHAQARQIEVEIRYNPGHLRIRVRDDGVGVDPNVLTSEGPAGHWGLKGIRERATRLGGKLDIWSERGAGTELELVIPASVAYAHDGPRTPWPWKRGKASQS